MAYIIRASLTIVFALTTGSLVAGSEPDWSSAGDAWLGDGRLALPSSIDVNYQFASEGPATSVTAPGGNGEAADQSDELLQHDFKELTRPEASSGCRCPKKSADKPNPCSTSHKGLFYNNDFSYLQDPAYRGCCLGDCWKNIPVGCCCGDCSTLDVGGQLRLRYHHERGMAQEPAPGNQRFTDTDNDFLLTRLRLYTNWKLNSWCRVYVEGIFADVGAEDDYVPRIIDRNYGDLLNAFVDLKATDSTTVRIGRQELLYGAQRTVSPLDWANTRRTFEGVRVLYKKDDWSIDGFYTNLVLPVANQFDEADYDIRFYGTYGVYSGIENHTIDFFYLGYDNLTPLGTAPPGSRDFSLHTIGARIYGSRGDWLYELEGAPQFGRQSGLGVDDMAGFATCGLGRKFPKVKWKPEIWVYYDYASGNSPGGDFNRYNQLFPLAHKYLGFIDATQRANIESPNVLVKMNPSKKVSLLFWYYHLMANNRNDIVPSIGGTPSPQGVSKDWGDELDLIVKYTFGPRSNILFGWSHFWRGNKIISPNNTDADFFYGQWELNF